MVPKDRHKIITAVYLILLNNKNENLLLKRANTGYEDGNYSLIAGHIDKKETAFEAMIREGLEEGGIVLERENLKLVHVMNRYTDHDRMDLFFSAQVWKGEPTNREPGKCTELRWFPIEDLPPNMIPCVREAIKNFCAKVLYSEFGWS